MRLMALSSASAAVLCVIRFVSACGSDPPPQPVMPLFPEAGSVEVEPSGECSAMCGNLAKLGCPESAIPIEFVDGGGMSHGRTCESTCTVAMNHKRNLRPLCVAKAADVQAVRLCCPKGTRGCTPVTCEGL